MYTSEVLADIHERSHRGLVKLIAHCAQLTSHQLRKDVEGFGYPRIQTQLCHLIGAEMYWVGVLEGRMDIDDRESQDPCIEELESFRAEVFNVTENYIAQVSAEDLNREAEFLTWGDQRSRLVPAQVIMRSQMHIFQHQGQIAAMCRHFGVPINGIDYPHS